jgi:hypothetical protein
MPDILIINKQACKNGHKKKKINKVYSSKKTLSYISGFMV